MCRPGLTFANGGVSSRECHTGKIVPLHWRGSLALGSSARRPMSHTGSRGQALAKSLLPVLKR